MTTSSSATEQRRIAAAVKRLHTLKLNECFDPVDVNSRPNNSQQAVLDDLGKYRVRFVTAGNQCLAEGTMVATTKGHKPIEAIVPGDQVFNEYGKPIEVLETFQNGTKLVNKYALTSGKVIYATADHKLSCKSMDGHKDIALRDINESTLIRGINRGDGTPLYDTLFNAHPYKKVPTYDIHVDSPTNLYCLSNGIITHNSGKSSTAGREVSWVFTERHPKWKRPQKWAGDNLTIIILGQTQKQIEEIMLPKVLGFIPESEYEIKRAGGIIKKVVHKNGNIIIPITYHDEKEARTNVQGFVAHYVWGDEMPRTLELVEECVRRIMSKEGYLLWTFTPKVVSDKVRKYVDNVAEPYGKRYKFSVFDNPIYDSEDRRAEVYASVEGLSEAYKQCILYGDWITAEGTVWEVDRDVLFKPLPPHYSAMWRHVEVVDPAIQSKLGQTIWAEDPLNGDWYCILARYVQGLYVPDLIVDETTKITKGYNIVKRVSDLEHWFINTANQSKRIMPRYEAVNEKMIESKKDNIIGVQAKLGQSMFFAPGGGTEQVVEEMEDMRWKDNGVDIVGSHRYHLVDTMVYFDLTKPKFAGPAKTNFSYADELLDQHRKRKAQTKVKNNKYRMRIFGGTRVFGGR